MPVFFRNCYYAIFILRMRKYNIACAFVLLLLLGSCREFYNLFYADPVKCYNNALSKKPYDVIIVPGFPYGSADSLTLIEERVSWALYLYKQGFTKHIIFSGAAVYTPYTEAKVMALFAGRTGVKPGDIMIETKAEHTAENVYNSYVMAHDSGFSKIAFATQVNQASFMKRFCRHWKLNIDMLPVNDSIHYTKYRFDTVNVSSLYVPDFVPITKRKSAIRRLRETRGLNVKRAIRKKRKN